MDRRAKVELFEEIRREYEFGSGSVRGIAKKLGVHRRVVRQAISSAVPPERNVQSKPCPRMDPVKPFIEAILLEDKRAPRKQRHTAHRIWVRLCRETSEPQVAESTLRAYVRERKQALGLLAGETHIPQCYGWGEEAQVDWYEAFADFDDARVKVQVFALRSMKSGAAFHRAYRHATQQAFFEAHEAAFAYFGGVFRTLRYDNLGSAVKKVLRGHTRDEHTRFVEFRSHWGFTSEFCTPAKPQEKGGVEGEAGYFRRNHLVPVPKVADLAELNVVLLAACREDESRVIGDRVIGDRPASVGEMLLLEREQLLPPAIEGFDLAESISCGVDGQGCVRTHTNRYSTPLAVGTRAVVRVLPSRVEVWHAGKQVASHERSYGRCQQVLNLEHYLDVLQKKPGALAGSVPLSQCRAQGRWPESFDRLWEGLMERQGKPEGTAAMVHLLLLAKDHSWERLRLAVEEALLAGCFDESAVVCFMLHPAGRAMPVSLSVEALGELCRYERPAPEMSDYDLLLEGAPGFAEAPVLGATSGGTR